MVSQFAYYKNDIDDDVRGRNLGEKISLAYRYLINTKSGHGNVLLFFDIA